MADSDKNILIRPNRGATSQPVITFTGQGNDPITLRVLDGATGTGITAGGALSFEGSAGQLFSVVNRLGTGSIFSVNDISGIPSIDVDANGTISLAGFTGNVGIGITGPTERLHVNGNIRVSGGVSAAGSTFGLITSTVGFTGPGITLSGNVRTLTLQGDTATFSQSVTTNLIRPTSGGQIMTMGLLSGGGQGTINFLASDIRVGPPSTLQGITFSTVAGVTMNIYPRHNLNIIPYNGQVRISTQTSGVLDLGTRSSITIPNSGGGTAPIQINGGNLYLGTKYEVGGFDFVPVDLVFGNPVNTFTTTITAPNTDSSSKTITLPNNTGTVALNNVDNSFSSIQSFTSGISASGICAGAFILTQAGIKALTGTTYTFLNSDNGDVLTHNNASGCTFTIPTGLPVGFSTTIIRLNANGRVGFTAASGVTLNSYLGFTAMAGQHASASLISYATNVFNLGGALA